MENIEWQYNSSVFDTNEVLAFAREETVNIDYTQVATRYSSSNTEWNDVTISVPPRTYELCGSPDNTEILSALNVFEKHNTLYSS